MASQNVGMAWRPRRLGVGSFDFTIEFAGQSPLKFDIFELQSDEHRKIGLVTSFWLRVSVRYCSQSTMVLTKRAQLHYNGSSSTVKGVNVDFSTSCSNTNKASLRFSIGFILFHISRRINLSVRFFFQFSKIFSSSSPGACQSQKKNIK